MVLITKFYFFHNIFLCIMCYNLLIFSSNLLYQIMIPLLNNNIIFANYYFLGKK